MRVGVHLGSQVEVEQPCPAWVEPDDVAGLGAEVDVIAGINDCRTPDLSGRITICDGFGFVADSEDMHRAAVIGDVDQTGVGHRRRRVGDDPRRMPQRCPVLPVRPFLSPFTAIAIYKFA